MYETTDLDTATFLHFKGFTDWETRCEKHLTPDGYNKIQITFIFDGDKRMFESAIDDFKNGDYYRLLQAHKQLKKTIWNLRNSKLK